MATESTFCNICAQSHLNIEAENYCPECEEFLCVDCNLHHIMSKATKRHSAISLQDFKELPLFVRLVKGHCENHQRQFEMFCSDHNCQLCVKCLNSHKNCDRIAPIDEIKKDVKLSSAIPDAEQSLKDLTENLRKIKDKLEQNKMDIFSKKETILSDIKMIRQKMIDYLDSLEKQLIDDITNAVQKNEKRIENLLQDLESKEKHVSIISSDLQRTKQFASEYQVFMTMKYIEDSITAEERYLQSLYEERCLDNVNLELITNNPIEHLNELKSFGEIHEVSEPCTISLLKKKEKQAQIGSVSFTKSIHNISLKLYDRIKIQSKENVKGCLFLSGNSIAITEYDPSRNGRDIVNVYRDNHFNRSLRTISGMDYDVNDAVILRENTFAATSNYFKKPFLFFVDYSKDEIVKKISTSPKPQCGITLQDNRLFYCEVGTGIQSYNLDTNATDIFLSNSKVKKTSYIAYFNQKLYYTYGDKVAVCDMTGNSVWEFQDTQILREPRGIAVDREGYIYVVGEATENVVVISPSGTEGKQLLGKEDGLQKPRAMKYDLKKHCLLVCNQRDVVFLFSIK